MTKEHLWWPGLPKNRNGDLLDVWAFSRGVAFSVDQPIYVPIKKKGRMSDIIINGFGTPIVSTKCARLLVSLAASDIQLVPAIIEGHGDAFIMNVVSVIDCLDFERSRVDFFPDDFYDQTKAGTPRMVSCLTIVESQAAGHHLFRIQGWQVAIVASQEVVHLVQKECLTGFGDWRKVS